MGSSGLAAHVASVVGPNQPLLAPQMPSPADPSCTAWQSCLEQHLATVRTEVVLIGHSLGGAVLLKLLSETSVPVTIAGLFLIAAPYWGADDDWQNSSFALADDFTRRLPPLPALFLYHSDHDPIVPFAHALRYAEAMPHAVLRRLPGRDHTFSDGLPQLATDSQGFV